MCILHENYYFKNKDESYKDKLSSNKYFLPSDLFICRYNPTLFFQDIFYVANKFYFLLDIDVIKILCSFYLANHVPCSAALAHLKIKRSTALKIFFIISLRIGFYKYIIKSIIEQRLLTWSQKNRQKILKYLEEFKNLPKPIFEEAYLLSLKKTIDDKFERNSQRKKTLRIYPNNIENDCDLYVYQHTFSKLAIYKKYLKTDFGRQNLLKSIRDSYIEINKKKSHKIRKDLSPYLPTLIVKIADSYLQARERTRRLKRARKRTRSLSSEENKRDDISTQKRRLDCALMLSEDLNALKSYNENDREEIAHLRYELLDLVNKKADPDILEEHRQEHYRGKIDKIEFEIAALLRIKKVEYYTRTGFFKRSVEFPMSYNELDKIYRKVNFIPEFDYNKYFPEIFGINNLVNKTGFMASPAHFDSMIKVGWIISSKVLRDQNKISSKHFRQLYNNEIYLKKIFETRYDIEMPKGHMNLDGETYFKNLAKKYSWSRERLEKEYSFYTKSFTEVYRGMIHSQIPNYPDYIQFNQEADQIRLGYCELSKHRRMCDELPKKRNQITFKYTGHRKISLLSIKNLKLHNILKDFKYEFDADRNLPIFKHWLESQEKRCLQKINIQYPSNELEEIIVGTANPGKLFNLTLAVQMHIKWLIYVAENDNVELKYYERLMVREFYMLTRVDSSTKFFDFI